jgi:hypothetical protein
MFFTSATVPIGTISARGVARLEACQVLTVASEPTIGLDDHLTRATQQIEVIDVLRAEIDLQRGEHIRRRETDLLGLDAIDICVDVDEIQRSVAVELLVVAQADLYAVVRRIAAMGQTVFAVVRLAPVEVDVDGVQRDDCPSRVDVPTPPRLPLTRPPTETRCAPMRPVNGAVMREKSRSSCASVIAALAASITACALRWSARR